METLITWISQEKTIQILFLFFKTKKGEKEMAFEIVEETKNGINSYSVYESCDQLMIMRNFMIFPNFAEIMEEMELAQGWHDEQWHVASCDYFPETDTYRLMLDPEDQEKHEAVWLSVKLQQKEHVKITDVLKQIDRDGKFVKIVEAQEEKYLQELQEENSYRYMIERESLSW